MKGLFRLFRKAARPVRKSCNTRLSVESLEDRSLMSVFNLDLSHSPLSENLKILPALGSATLDGGFLRIEGTDTTNDNIKVFVENFNSVPLLKVTIANVNSPQTLSFDLKAVTNIIVRTYGGNDLIDNRTGRAMSVDAGAGDDVILGGAGSDTVAGGDGNDYIDGRSGDDLLMGNANNDVLFGDDGADNLYGGSENDSVFGGNGVDRLAGEAGADLLDGGAGADSFRDTEGANQIFQNYAPAPKTVTSLAHFDFFDRFMTNAPLRSLARLQHRDLLTDRNDMLKLFAAAAQDKVVSSTEFASLQALLGSNLIISEHARFLGKKVVNGDRANAHYHGAKLGNLFAGTSGSHLNALVDKWFKGGDRPSLGDHNASYVFATGSLFVNGPSYEDINQGSVGDCYFMSALGTIAQHSPDTITNMFIDNGDGTFTVTFFSSGVKQFVTVDRLLPASGRGFAVFAGVGFVSGTFRHNVVSPDAELWVALAEKAYVQLSESGWTGQAATNTYDAIDGGDPGLAYRQLTGKSSSNYGLGSSAGGVIGGLEAYNNQGLALMLWTKDSGVDDGWTQNHVYMVVGYDPAARLFKIANPHGSDATATYEMWVDGNMIVRNCDYVTVAHV